MGKHFVKPLLLMLRRIRNIKVNPTAMGEGRWIEWLRNVSVFGV
jgi:hypothetical protein